jgi:formylglycine-generating enzyme required for sulfatase activity
MGRMAMFLSRKRVAKPDSQSDGARQRATAAMLNWEFGDDDPIYDIELTSTPAVNGDDRAARTHERFGRVNLDRLRPEPRPQAEFRRADTVPSHGADGRFMALVDVLDEALDRWWSDDELPPLALLREGLLALEAGHDLDEGQRTLLLRAALAYRKGILTALRHQTDAERSAFLLKEALLNVWSPLAPLTLWQLRQEDEQREEWVPALQRELQDELSVAQGVQQQLAVQALTVLDRDEPPSAVAPGAIQLTPSEGFPSVLEGKEAPAVQSYWSPGRVIIGVLFVLSVVAGLLFYRNHTPQLQAATIPTGAYTIGEPTAERTVTLGTFAVDTTEVTNAAYQQCLAAGQCPAPGAEASATRPDYFADLAFAAFPVINVNWDGAQAYCAWRGNRLPSADEWETAASIAPATKRHFRFPWGEQFDPRLANTAAAKVGDTTQVGTYHPAGDSSFGLADAAGNVAEWTATRAPVGSDAFVVKGGSFQDEPAGIQTSARRSVERQAFADWLGFRCVTDLAP